MFMQTDKVDCAPLPGQRTYGVFFHGVPLFFLYCILVAEGGKYLGLALMHKRMKEIG